MPTEFDEFKLRLPQKRLCESSEDIALLECKRQFKARVFSKKIKDQPDFVTERRSAPPQSYAFQEFKLKSDERAECNRKKTEAGQTQSLETAKSGQAPRLSFDKRVSSFKERTSAPPVLSEKRFQALPMPDFTKVFALLYINLLDSLPTTKE